MVRNLLTCWLLKPFEKATLFKNCLLIILEQDHFYHNQVGYPDCNNPSVTSCTSFVNTCASRVVYIYLYSYILMLYVRIWSKRNTGSSGVWHQRFHLKWMQLQAPPLQGNWFNMCTLQVPKLLFPPCIICARFFIKEKVFSLGCFIIPFPLPLIIVYALKGKRRSGVSRLCCCNVFFSS